MRADVILERTGMFILFVPEDFILLYQWILHRQFVSLDRSISVSIMFHVAIFLCRYIENVLEELDRSYQCSQKRALL